MKIIKDNEELKTYIRDYKIVFDCSIKCDFNINVNASIEAWNIEARNIEARNIKAMDIEARNIEAFNIEAWNIKAMDIEAWNIEARNIKAWNIEARNIEARNIKARDINFWAFCISRVSLTCKSIKGIRGNNIFTCLDSEIKYTIEETNELTIEQLEKLTGINNLKIKK